MKHESQRVRHLAKQWVINCNIEINEWLSCNLWIFGLIHVVLGNDTIDYLHNLVIHGNSWSLIIPKTRLQEWKGLKSQNLNQQLISLTGWVLGIYFKKEKSSVGFNSKL